MKKFLCALVLSFCFSCQSWAAEPEDFSYKTLVLGDSYTQMVEKLGKPRYDIDKTVASRAIVYYFYNKETRIGIAKDTDSVVDIRLADKQYEGKHGVRIGATHHKILKEYGENQRVRSGHGIFYIYANAPFPEQKLMFDVTEGFLREIRITNLGE